MHSALHYRAQFEPELERKTRVGIIQVHPGDAGDALQAVGQRISMNMQRGCGLAEIAMACKKGLQRLNQLGVMIFIMRNQRLNRLAEKSVRLPAATKPGQQLI